MNSELIKAKMESFFANASPQYIVSELERLGYTFVDKDVPCDVPPVSFFERLRFWRNRRVKR